jgi:hypothetical protein
MRAHGLDPSRGPRPRVVRVVQNGEPIWHQAYGGVSLDTPLNVASVDGAIRRGPLRTYLS